MVSVNEIYMHLVERFKMTLGLSDMKPPAIYLSTFTEAYGGKEPDVPSDKDIERIITDVVAEKLDIYHSTVQAIIDECARAKIYFNYMEKLELASNIKDKGFVSVFLGNHGIDEQSIARLTAYDIEDLISIRGRVSDLIQTDTRWKEVIESIFSAYLYYVLHRPETLEADYFEQLRKDYPQKYIRDNALNLLVINRKLYERYGDYDRFVGFVFAMLRKCYKCLNNYCYFSVYLDSDLDRASDGESIFWRLYSDIVLFAEKHILEPLKIGYFHPDKIKEVTRSYIKDLGEDVDFNIANGGFTYKDCYIIAGDELRPGENFTKYSALLLFQKNERDEDALPCPSCMSLVIRGNSYPVIGVKSWECKNPLCPGKSKYNRGKRYSFSSILKQESICSADNVIDRGLINEWRLDMVTCKTLPDVLEMLIKEYSFVGDTVKVYTDEPIESLSYGRNLLSCKWPNVYEDPDGFWNCDYFKRFMVEDDRMEKFESYPSLAKQNFYRGNCRDVLNALPPETAEGAVTSPPYYNAMSYSQWDNIYCYLYDMYNQGRAVYRTLKQGGLYLYNIFDYFDNERNLVFSDMGKKRMILGAYIIRMFRDVGFKIAGNIIWYKGHIQGNRSNNQGNNSPYYQAPLNCYEHIFVFRKGDEGALTRRFPDILNVKPVIKMIKGKNVLGHTAPFPEVIPELLLSRISKGTVVDPYAGSFTTARVAYKMNRSSICIEQKEEYCELGKKILRAACKEGRCYKLKGYIERENHHSIV